MKPGLSAIRIVLAAALALLMPLTLAACGGERADERPVLVLAASSLQGALDEAADAWAAQGHPRPVMSYAGTPALARQVEAGSPADLFISADEQWMDELADKRLIDRASRTQAFSNTLVLVAPRGSDLGEVEITADFVRDRLGASRLAMADPDAVPAGRYGKQALQHLGIWTAVAGHIAPAENVRAALALVAQGEAPLGIVYASDAQSEPAVQVVGRFPADSHAPISYPLARLVASSNPGAEAFRAFLLTDAAQAIFARHGFGPRPA